MRKLVKIGDKFGKLTVIEVIGIEESSTKKTRYKKVKCLCECGNKIETYTYLLTKGDKKSCGCLRGKNREIDLTGQRFGKLLVLEKIKNERKYKCICDCGNYVDVQSKMLREGRTKSCGCLYDGRRYTRLYGVWIDMKTRCYNSNFPNYKNYGGRGIKICDEWLKWENFKKWAYENGYDENAKRGKCTIDRINNDGNYEPGNCRWTDMKTQRANQRPKHK